MREFTYNAHPGRVIFGSGTTSGLAAELDVLKLNRVVVLSTPGQAASAKQLGSSLGDRCVAVLPTAVMHTPVDVTERTLTHVQQLSADGLVALGGGSAIGLSKAIALRTDLPQIVIPTTYAGSEMTPIVGETKDGVKVTQSSPAILPETVIYDVDLTLNLPVGISGVSGLNAIAHAVEALYARDRNPVTSLMAKEGVRALASALPLIASDPGNAGARSDALYGAWLCGTCLGAVGMALHHKVCHTLGGTFGLPHAETHSIMLPHALAYNIPAAPEAAAALNEALGSDDAAGALYDLGRAVDAPAALRDIGMPESGIDQAVELIFRNPYWNPRPLEAEPIRAMIRRVWAGERPPREPLQP
jgi:alcohol dehydrogenase class IV